MSLITECFNKVNWIQNYVACPLNEKEHEYTIAKEAV